MFLFKNKIRCIKRHFCALVKKITFSTTRKENDLKYYRLTVNTTGNITYSMTHKFCINIRNDHLMPLLCT